MVGVAYEAELTAVDIFDPFWDGYLDFTMADLSDFDVTSHSRVFVYGLADA